MVLFSRLSRGVDLWTSLAVPLYVRSGWRLPPYMSLFCRRERGPGWKRCGDFSRLTRPGAKNGRLAGGVNRRLAGECGLYLGMGVTIWNSCAKKFSTFVHSYPQKRPCYPQKRPFFPVVGSEKTAEDAESAEMYQKNPGNPSVVQDRPAQSAAFWGERARHNVFALVPGRSAPPCLYQTSFRIEIVAIYAAVSILNPSGD